MIIPCIDLMGGRVVQLVRGREKALEGPDPEEMLMRFQGFPEIQVIDLDAALGTGDNAPIVEALAAREGAATPGEGGAAAEGLPRPAVRAGGGVRTVERAERLLGLGAAKVIVGTAAFRDGALNRAFLGALAEAVGRERVVVALDSEGGEVVVRGWTEGTGLRAEGVVRDLEPFCGGVLCTFVDREGTMEGTNLEWFARLRAATPLRITAAGGVASLDEVRALQAMDVDVALGMAVYTGRLRLEDLRRSNL